MDAKCTRGASVTYLTTENPDRFAESASVFMQQPVKAEKIQL